MMKLQELKNILADIKATNVRFGGFCDAYGLLPTQYQLRISEKNETINITNDVELNGYGSEIYDDTTFKDKLLSLPDNYNNYDLFLSGTEDTSEQSIVIVIKEIKTVRILHVSDNENCLGVCLLGPVADFNSVPVYYTHIIIEDDGAKELTKSQRFESIMESYCPALYGYDDLFWLDEVEGKVSIDMYTDLAHSDMLLAMLDGQFSGVFFMRMCLDDTESTYLSNDINNKYWMPYYLKVVFADTRDCQQKCGLNTYCTENGQVCIDLLFETETEREDYISAYRHEINESVGDKVYNWDKELFSDIMQLIIDAE